MSPNNCCHTGPSSPRKALATEKAEDDALKHVGSWLTPNDLKPPEAHPQRLKLEDLGVASTQSTHHHSGGHVAVPVPIYTVRRGSLVQQSPGRGPFAVHPRQEEKATRGDAPEKSTKAVASSAADNVGSTDAEQGSPGRRSISPL